MTKSRSLYVLIIIVSFLSPSCSKSGSGTPSPTPANLYINSITLDGLSADLINVNTITYNVNTGVTIRISLSTPVKRSSVTTALSLQDVNAVAVPMNIGYANNDSTIIITPQASLGYLTKYLLHISTQLESAQGKTLYIQQNVWFITRMDSTDKFPIITDNSLMDTIQRRTFRYFWDFAHPVSGLARERNTSGETVTSGGSGFGIMAIPVAISRNFITRAQGLSRMQTIVAFLKNTAQRFHGAYPHWLNGTTGLVVPFGVNDDGADLVETSYLMMGLLTARQYFNDPGAAETNLRNDINAIYNTVEWSWFRQGGRKVLYWNWSPNSGWAVNVPIQGWNECLITYVMAASSSTYGIPRAVYDSGYARNGAMVNNSSYYGYNLPLGQSYGGPLFFEHYSFMGINPNGLNDAYANYQTQVINHSKINFEYCKANPRSYFGYSDQCWGLTASDIPNGYTASSPTNDVGTIAPTAAISSLPYTPSESMMALRFFYYKLGDKIWGQYGFTDAFSLHNLWFANSYLAIDEGPIIVMMENYRTGMIWNLFTSCPEVKAGMLSLGFTAPYL